MPKLDAVPLGESQQNPRVVGQGLTLSEVFGGEAADPRTRTVRIDTRGLLQT